MDHYEITKLRDAAGVLEGLGEKEIADFLSCLVDSELHDLQLAEKLVDVYYSCGVPEEGMQKVVKHLRSLGWIEPYEIPVESYDEWNDWENVPVGVKVFDHSIASTNSNGEHCAWQKKEDGTVLFWVSHNPTTPTVSGLSEEYRSTLGPFVRADVNG